jgi:methyl-accepting chemotaxis protein
MRASGLDDFRRQGVRLVVGGGWICVIWLWLMGLALHQPMTGRVVMLGMAINVLPTLRVWRGRYDSSTRMVAATLATAHPALGLYLLQGNPWQMDWHMYFFVAMAALMVMCDWKPIVVAALLTAAHHLLLLYLAPSWVFEGSTGVSLGRVAMHSVAVVLQAGALAFVTTRLRNLMVDQATIQARAEHLAEVARERSHELEAAIRRAADAAALAEKAHRGEQMQRQLREQAEHDAADLRRRDMVALAEGFEASVSDVAERVLGALRDLDRSAQLLGTSARRTTTAAADIEQIVDETSTRAGDLARRTVELSDSMTVISTDLQAQDRTSSQAGELSLAAREAVSQLLARTGKIGGFAATIDGLARQTNLLALNASIEASRAGAAGRGFAVVASEVKGLANRAQDATSSVKDLARLATEGAEQSGSALFEIATLVEEFAEAAQSIRGELRRQHQTASFIKDAARETATDAVAIAGQMHEITRVAHETAGLSAGVDKAVRDLLEVAAHLKQSTALFTAQLRTA